MKKLAPRKKALNKTRATKRYDMFPNRRGLPNSQQRRTNLSKNLRKRRSHGLKSQIRRLSESIQSNAAR